MEKFSLLRNFEFRNPSLLRMHLAILVECNDAIAAETQCHLLYEPTALAAGLCNVSTR